MKFSFIYLIRFRVDNATVFQRVSMNLNMTVGQAACRLLIYSTFAGCFLYLAESYGLLRVNQAKDLVTARVWNAPDQSTRLYRRSELYVGLAALSYNKNIVASSEQYCSFVSVSITKSSFGILDVIFSFKFSLTKSFRNQFAIEYLRKFVLLPC